MAESNPPVEPGQPFDAQTTLLLRRMLHDLKAPVRHIRGFSRMLQDTLDQPVTQWDRDEAQESIDVIERAGRSMDDLLDSIREWLIDESSSKVAPLSQIVHDLWAEISRQYNVGDLEPLITIADDRNLPCVAWSKMLRPLLDNALRYRRDNQPTKIEISAEDNGDQWTVTLTDNGSGMDSDKIQRARQPFERLRVSQPPRPGLGLAIADRWAARLDCVIDIESQPDEGTVIRIRPS